MPPEESGASKALIRTLRENFTFQGMIGEALYKDNVRLLLEAAGPLTRVFILLAPEGPREREATPAKSRPKALINRWTAEIAADFTNTELLNITDYLDAAKPEPANANHFDRITYFHVYQDIMRRIRGAAEARQDRTLEAIA